MEWIENRKYKKIQKIHTKKKNALGFRFCMVVSVCVYVDVCVYVYVL